MTNKKSKWPNITNDTIDDKIICATVERQDGSIYEQDLSWQKNETISHVLTNYQRMLGSTKYYRIVDFYIVD